MLNFSNFQRLSLLLSTVFIINCSSSAVTTNTTPLNIENIISLSSNIGPARSNIPLMLTNEEVSALKVNLKTLPDVWAEPGEVAILETSLGNIVFALLPAVAPNHSMNFKKLANSGYYDWTFFHRVIKNFMIQGGDINSKDDIQGNEGSGGPGYTVNAEFSRLNHTRGMVSAARTMESVNTAGSQFFIVHQTLDGVLGALDGKYTIFGRVLLGLDVLDKIANAKTSRDNPLETIYIKRARVVKR